MTAKQYLRRRGLKDPRVTIKGTNEVIFLDTLLDDWLQLKIKDLNKVTLAGTHPTDKIQLIKYGTSEVNRQCDVDG